MTRIPAGHPRAESLMLRERLGRHFKAGVVVPSGLMAHGRGEAFDYLLGERTIKLALEAIWAAAAALLLAKKPVISVNGNVAALASKEVIELADLVGADIEVNLFHRPLKRELAISRLLKGAGAKMVLGVGRSASARLPGLKGNRSKVDPRGILSSDVVLVPLEDGDRTEALVKMGKKVIAIDLNPLSRTAQQASITIVDNLVRALPMLIKASKELKSKSKDELKAIVNSFDNGRCLELCIQYIKRNLGRVAMLEIRGPM